MQATMSDLADAFIGLPGGFGTLEEMLEVITWSVVSKSPPFAAICLETHDVHQLASLSPYTPVCGCLVLLFRMLH